MADRAALLAEAYRRGLLPPEQKAAYEEAQRRGLVGAKPRAAPARGIGGEVAGAAMNLYESIPFMDEGAAVLGAGARLATGQAKSIPDAWRQAREFQDTNADDFQSRRPMATAVIKGAGTGASLLVPAGGQVNALAQGGRAINAARGAVTAAGNAYLYGASDRGTVAERAKAGARAAADPVTLGLGAVAGGVATPGKPKPGKAPTRAELTTQRKAAYGEVKASGQRYTPDQFRGFVDQMKRDLAAADFDPDFDPAVATMLRKLDEKAAQGYAPTLQEVDLARRFIRKNVASRGDGNQRRLGREMIASLDRGLDAAGGDETLQRARDLYGREMKVATVENAMAKAKKNARKSGSGANTDNTIRQRMDGVLEKTFNLTGDERAALEDIVNGTPVRNALRSYGQTSPLSGGLGAMLNAGSAVASGGTTFWAHTVPSTVAKLTADGIAKAKVRDLVQLVAAGGSREQLLAVQQRARSIEGPAGSALRRMVAARLSAAAGAQGGARQTMPSNALAQPARPAYP